MCHVLFFNFISLIHNDSTEISWIDSPISPPKAWTMSLVLCLPSYKFVDMYNKGI